MKYFSRFSIVCLASLSLFSMRSPAQWVQTSLGYASVYTLALSGTNLFAATSAGTFLSTDNGTTWRTANVPFPGFSHMLYDGSNLFAASGVGVFLSTNMGTSWTAVGLTNVNVRALAMSSTNLFAGTAYIGVFLSTNNGTSWTAVNTGLTSLFISALAVGPADNGSAGAGLFAGSDDHGVFLTTNNGGIWTAVNTGLTNPYVSALAVSPADGPAGGTNLFAGTGSPPGNPNGVFLSTNNGTSWTSVLISADVQSFAVRLAAGGAGATTVFAGTFGGGVYLFTNNGSSWRRVNTGLTNLDVLALAASPDTSGNLFAGTGAGVWRRPLSEMITSVQPVSHELPERLAPDQNYPNPFNPSTTISFTIPHSSYVVLKIYNIMGQEVKTLVNERKDEGEHLVQFNAEGLPSGVYWYRLSTSGSTLTRKMLFIK